MKTSYRDKGRRSRASFLRFAVAAILLSSVMTAAVCHAKTTYKTKTKTIPNTFMTPDFAFPKDVNKNARIRLEEALSKNKPAEAITAAIQITISDGLISQSTFKESAMLFDSLYNVLPAPYSSVASMIEAGMFSSLYSSKPYYYDRRTAIEGPAPEDPDEWSAKNFADTTLILVKRALENKEELSKFRCSELKEILTDCKDAERENFTVADYLTAKGVDALRNFSRTPSEDIIPFGIKNPGEREENISDYILSLLNYAIDDNAARNNLFAEAYFINLKLGFLKGEEKDKLLKAAIDRFKDTPYCARFMSEIAVYNDDKEENNAIRRKNYELLTCYRNKFPDAYDIRMVEELISSLTSQNATLRFNDTYLPYRKDSVSVRTENIYDFHLLVYELPGNILNTNVKFEDLSKVGKLAKSIPVKLQGKLPDMAEGDIELPGLNPGFYTIAVSTDGTYKGILNKNRTFDIIRVSEITAIISSAKGLRSLFAVSAFNGKPIKDAEVKIYEKKGYRQDIYKKTMTTDSNGEVKLPEDYLHYNCKVSYKGNYAEADANAYYDYMRNYGGEDLRGKLFTDLGIYRPGDEMRFSGVLYTENNKSFAPFAGGEISVVLRDANYQEIDSVKLVTDRFGRTDGSFKIPKSGLLGRWNIHIRKGNYEFSSADFRVEEYKTPGSYVEMDKSDSAYEPGNLIKFSGRAMTYSGMPVTGAKVNVEISYTPWFYLYRDVNNAKYSTETITDSDGRFKIELETTGLRGTEFARAAYTMQIDVTDAAGETRAAEPLRFSIGKALNIDAGIPDRICADGEKENLYVRVTDLIGRNVSETVYYRLFKDGKEIESGNFTSPVFILNYEMLPSGEYLAEFSLSPDFGNDDEKTEKAFFTIWRKTDKTPAAKTMLWIDEDEVTAQPGEKSVKIRVGSSFPESHILVNVCTSESVKETRWIEVSDGFANIDIDSPADNERVYINFATCRMLDVSSRQVTVIPYYQTEKLKPEIVTFRDKMVPGEKESWKIRFTIEEAPQADIPVMAVMSDKALEALAPFNWNFNPYASLSWTSAQRYLLERVGGNSLYVNIPTKHDYKTSRFFVMPDWQTYGYGLGGRFIELRAMKNSMKFRSAEVTDAMGSIAEDDMDFMIEESAPMAESGGTEEEAQIEKESIELRETDCPLAFFMPGLVTDDSGMSIIEFEAPQFVGTWTFRIVGYTPEMKGASLKLDAISAKKVMAQLNAPRFVRTGDRLFVTATIFNNTDSAQTIKGRIDLCNPFEGKILKSFTSSEKKTGALQSMVVETELEIPDNLQALEIRAYGYMDGYNDGERIIIPVLPSSTPTVDSETFYIAPGVKEFSMRLPKMDKRSLITLSYCDNPVWECVTALPSLTAADNCSILATAYSLYGNCVANGLLTKYPRLLEGIEKIADEGALMSPLEKNQELKTVLLNNTPWVNDAEAETMRMLNLQKYADKETTMKVIEDGVAELTKRMNPDGGWGWCPGMESSQFITCCVLNVLFELKNMGYLPEEAYLPVVSGARYMEKSMARDWKQAKYKSYPKRMLIDYLYGKSMWNEIVSEADFKKLEDKVLTDIRNDWRKYDVYDKATCAIILWRKGYRKESELMMESLTQFASESERKGMWFDNLSETWTGPGELLTTARALEAYALTDPENRAVDKLRQWLVTSKQTQNWGANSFTAAAVNAILTTGTDWKEEAGAPVIEIDGKPIDHEIEAVTGNVTIDLDPEKMSEKLLTIKRSGIGPAWGGVITQYVATISEIKPSATPELKVKKEIYVLTATESGDTGKTADPTIGEKVRVLITIESDRDMEYVAVTDPRAACLEPTDKTSGYSRSDGLWLYKEVRNDATNLFIPYLPKGTSIITYDCHADRQGEYSLGAVSAQSQYAPSISARSGGGAVKVSSPRD